MALILTIIITGVSLVLVALINTADRTGNKRAAALQATTLNILLWVVLPFWFGAARRDGWPDMRLWGPLVFAWATVATLALFLWVAIAVRPPARTAPAATPTMEQVAAAIDEPQAEARRGPKINGKYPASTPALDVDEDTELRIQVLRDRYRGKA